MIKTEEQTNIENLIIDDLCGYLNEYGFDFSTLIGTMHPDARWIKLGSPDFRSIFIEDNKFILGMQRLVGDQTITNIADPAYRERILHKLKRLDDEFGGIKRKNKETLVAIEDIKSILNK